MQRINYLYYTVLIGQIYKANTVLCLYLFTHPQKCRPPPPTPPPHTPLRYKSSHEYFI